MPVERAVRTLALAGTLALAAGCGGGSGPPPIARGVPCVTCGMAVQDLRFAAELERDGRWRVFDSIECLLREPPDGSAAWLSDYDTETLVRADSAWVVRGAFPSPMGGGLAAFRAREAAESVAAGTGGRVGRLASFAGELAR